MKKLLFSALMLGACATAWAVPARPGFKTFTQPDGSTVMVQKVGDEWHHRMVTADGYAVAKAADGSFCYRTATGVSNVVAHNVNARPASEVAFLQSLDKEAINKPGAKARAKAGKANATRRKSQVPDVGSPRVPIILVEFDDVPFSVDNPKEVFDNQFNKAEVSCHKYFYDQSNGMYDGQFEILGPVTIGNRSTYGDNDSEGNDKGVALMVSDACKKLGTSVDWSRYDNDGDNEVDVVVVLYAGVGEADDDTEEAIWPCQWDLNSGAEYGDGSGRLIIGGIKIDRFGVFNELGGNYSGHHNELDGIGTFCHEFSHCLGLPDWYATDYSNHFGMGNWSILDGGCYNNDGFTPCGYTSYEKAFHGWRALEDAVPNTYYSLDATNLPTGVGIKVQSDKDENEYYILENRQLTGWDAYLPNHGLQVTHVYYSAKAWEDNEVNNTSTRRMTIIPADNSLKMVRDFYGNYQADPDDQVNDLYPYEKGNKLINELTDTSTPAAKLYNGGYMGKPITQITDANGVTSFYYMKDAIVRPVPELAEAADVNATGFTAQWSECDDAVSYTLRLREKGEQEAPVALITEDFSALELNTSDQGNSLDEYFANEGWTGSAVFFEDGGVRLASGKKAGSLVSPEMTFASGKVTVVATAYSYSNDGDITVGVKTSKGSQDLTVKSFEQELVLVLDAAQTDNVTFSATQKKRPVFTGITFYDGDVTGQLGVAEPEAVLYEGITGTSYVLTDLEEGLTYVFDVKAVFGPADESAWSNQREVTLVAQEREVGDVDGNGVVNGSDVTALYNYLLNGAAVAGEADVDGNGTVNGSDVTALYNMLLSAE